MPMCFFYAVNSASEHHRTSRRWLDDALSGSDTVGFAWMPLLAFVRLTTKVGLFPSPLLPGRRSFRSTSGWRRPVRWSSA